MPSNSTPFLVRLRAYAPRRVPVMPADTAKARLARRNARRARVVSFYDSRMGDRPALSRAAWRSRMATRNPRPARETARLILRNAWRAGPALYLPWARMTSPESAELAWNRAREAFRFYMRRDVRRAFRKGVA